VRGRRRSSQASRLLALEGLAVGLAYGAGLCFGSVCLVASFRVDELSTPYWRTIPGLRTDTSGIAAFFVVAVCGSVSEFLRLRRLRAAVPSQGESAFGGPTRLLILAVARTTILLVTALVIYLSVNAITHPATLAIHATHLVAWPTEGTLRAIALLLCASSAGVIRYLQAYRGSPVGRALATGEDRSSSRYVDNQESHHECHEDWCVGQPLGYSGNDNPDVGWTDNENRTK
jgi:hypothetical protein